jgi:hypothetical protein
VGEGGCLFCPNTANDGPSASAPVARSVKDKDNDETEDKKKQDP